MKLYIVILAKDKGASSLLFFDIFVLLKREFFSKMEKTNLNSSRLQF